MFQKGAMAGGNGVVGSAMGGKGNVIYINANESWRSELNEGGDKDKRKIIY